MFDLCRQLGSLFPRSVVSQVSCFFPGFISFCFRFFLGFCKVRSGEELQLGVKDFFVAWESYRMRLNKGWLGKKEAREQKVAGAAIEERVELLGERKVFEMSRKSLVPASRERVPWILLWSTWRSRSFWKSKSSKPVTPEFSPLSALKHLFLAGISGAGWEMRQGLVVEFQERTKIIPYLQAFIGSQVRIRTET